MTPAETIRYLEQSGRFYGARCIDTGDTVYLVSNQVEVYVGDEKQRTISQSRFARDYSGERFAKVAPVAA